MENLQVYKERFVAIVESQGVDNMKELLTQCYFDYVQLVTKVDALNNLRPDTSEQLYLLSQLIQLFNTPANN